MKWVLAPVVTREMGLTVGQLRGMIDRDTLRRGVHWQTIEHKRFFNLEAIQEWLNSEASAQAAQESKSATRSAAAASRYSSTRRRLNPTSRMQLVIGGS